MLTVGKGRVQASGGRGKSGCTKKQSELINSEWGSTVRDRVVHECYKHGITEYTKCMSLYTVSIYSRLLSGCKSETLFEIKQWEIVGEIDPNEGTHNLYIIRTILGIPPQKSKGGKESSHHKPKESRA